MPIDIQSYDVVVPSITASKGDRIIVVNGVVVGVEEAATVTANKHVEAFRNAYPQPAAPLQLPEWKKWHSTPRINHVEIVAQINKLHDAGMWPFTTRQLGDYMHIPSKDKESRSVISSVVRNMLKDGKLVNVTGGRYGPYKLRNAEAQAQGELMAATATSLTQPQ